MLQASQQRVFDMTLPPPGQASTNLRLPEYQAKQLYTALKNSFENPMNKGTKEFANAWSTATKSAGKIGAKLGAKAIGKSILKKIPGIGLLAGIGFGLQRAYKGDFAGAALEFSSGALSTIPGLGTAGSVAIDAGLAARDYKKATTASDFISRPGQPIQKFRADDIVVGGTSLGGGGNVEQLLNKILAAIENGGDVYMDGNKVGKSLALATSDMG